VIANSTDAIPAVTLTKAVMAEEAEIIAKAAAQSPAPAANEGELSDKLMADPETTRVWPATKTRNAAASNSLPSLM
jgi:hypothetical protein